MSSEPKSFKAAAEVVLTAAGIPMKSSEITQAAIDKKLISTKGKTPAATMAAQLAVDVGKPDSIFIRTAPATYGLASRDGKSRRTKN